MGKLNIAHHKSYHPYRADNIERVRRDEEEARIKEECEEGRMMMADAEARLGLLRQRSGISSSSKKRAARLKDEEDMKRIADGTQGLTRASDSAPEIPSITTSSGHINLFPSLESSISGQQLQLIEKKQRELAAQKEAEKGAPLAPSAHDLTPWYADRELKGGAERDLEKDDRANDRRQRKQSNAKFESDPLRAMKAHLARRAEVLASPSSATPTFKVPSYPDPRPSASQTPEGDPARAARLARESSERARADALKARKKRELEAGSMTPSSVVETPRSEYDYRDVFNVKETREAREARERGRARHWGSRRWDEDGDGDRERERARDRDRDRDREARRWRS